MQIPLVVLILGVLIPVSGLIAWAGDRIGHQVGKRRHTLLGLRPRHTAMLFTIGSGVGISLVSFALLWLSSEGFRMILSQGVQLLTVNKSLRAQNVALADEVKERTTQTESARAEATRALHDRDDALGVRDTAFAASVKAREELFKARDELSAAQHAVTQARTAFEQMQNRLGTTEGHLTEARAGLKTAQQRFLIAQQRVTQAEQARSKADKAAVTSQLAAQKALRNQSETERNAERTISDTGKLLAEQKQRLEDQKLAFDKEEAKQKEDLSRLQNEVANLETRRQELATLLGASLSRTTALRRGQITYRIGEEVDRVAISSDQSIWKIELALQNFFKSANTKAAGRGATGSTELPQRSVALAPHPVASAPGSSETGTASNAALPSEDEAIRNLAQSIRRSDEQVAVVLTAAANAVVGEPVLVDMKTYRNPVVLASGIKLGETTLNGSPTMTRQEAADTVYEFLRHDIRKSLLDAGVIPTETGDPDDGGSSVVSLTGSEWLKIMDDVKRANFHARVTVKTAKPIRAADPVVLEFEVKALSGPPPTLESTQTGTQLPGNIHP